MTVREATIQAQVEMGRSPEEAELRAQYSDCFLPGSGCPVRPGMEREFIEFLKQVFRQIDANPQAWRDEIARRMEKLARQN